MGDIGTATRRSPRIAGSPHASPVLSPVKHKAKRSGDGSALKARSVSSPPYRARSGSRESESQSGSDAENTRDHSFGYKPESQDHYTLLQSSPHSEQNYRKNDQASGRAKPYVPGPKKHADGSFHLGPSHMPSVPSVPTMLTLLGILIAIPVLMVIAQIVSPSDNTSLAEPRTLGDIEDDIVRDLDKLRSETKQEMNFWRSLYSGLTTVTEAAPRQPLVLLMAVPLDASLTAVCLAHHITDIVSQAFGDPSVVKHDTLSHLQMPWDDHKLALDSRLQNLSKTHAAIIYNLEKMPPKTATLLHGYFDNDNAPHKRAAIVVLLELELHYSSVSEAHLDLTVERRLHELWRQDLDQDNIPGLISRVAILPLLVKPESKFVLQKLCPL